MLKRRIIPVELLLDRRLVKTVRFDTYRDVGDPVASSKVYSDQDADELILLNIARSSRTIHPLLELIEKLSSGVFMPLTAGGGIRSLPDVEALIRNGADKVSINSACYEDPSLVSKAAEKFGSQAVVISIDVRRDPSTGTWKLFSDCGRRPESSRLEDHLADMIRRGAGEFLINSIDRDGTMEGYDLELVRRVVEASPVPVIACGGAGNYVHLKEGFLDAGAQALACGSLFNFGDNNPLRAKAFLLNYGVPLKVI